MFYSCYKSSGDGLEETISGISQTNMAAPSWPVITSALDLTEETNLKVFHWILKSNKGTDVICLASIIENRTISYSKKKKKKKINEQNISRIFGDMVNYMLILAL